MEAGVEALISECAGNANVLVEVNSTVGKLPKLSSLLELCSPKTVSSLLFACPGVILSDFSEWRFHPLPPPSNIDHHHVSSFHHVCHQITPPSRIGQSREKGICDYNVPAASSGFCKKKGSTLAQEHLIVHIHPQGIKKNTHVFGVSHFCGWFLKVAFRTDSRKAKGIWVVGSSCR